MPESRRCPSCEKPVPVRVDGSLGRHFTSSGKDRQRCAAGEIGRRPTPSGRRLTVTVTAVVPYSVAAGEFRTLVADVIRERVDAFVLDVGAAEGSHA